MELYTILEASEKLGIKHGRLREWISRHYIMPHQQATGRGTKNLLSKWNLYQIALFAYLLWRGFNRDKLGAMVLSLTIPIDLEKYNEDVKKSGYRGKDWPDIDITNYKFPDFFYIFDDGSGYQNRYLSTNDDGYIWFELTKDIRDGIIINFEKIRKEVDALF